MAQRHQLRGGAVIAEGGLKRALISVVVVEVLDRNRARDREPRGEYPAGIGHEQAERLQLAEIKPKEPVPRIEGPRRSVDGVAGILIRQLLEKAKPDRWLAVR